MRPTSEQTPELIYWIPKFILMQNDKPFSQLGYMSNPTKCAPSQKVRTKLAGGTLQRGTYPHTSTIFSSSISRCPTTFSMAPIGLNNSSPSFSKSHTHNGSTATSPCTTGDRDTYAISSWRTYCKRSLNSQTSNLTKSQRAADSS